jgi:hypothetical protein
MTLFQQQMKRVIKSVLFFIAIFSILHSTIAQEIKVVSSIDNSPLPYATVTNHTHPLVVSSDKNGLAKITAAVGDTVSIAYVGYKTSVLRFDGNKNQIVSLTQEQSLLPSVTVHNCRKTREFIYKNSEFGYEWRRFKGSKFNTGIMWLKSSTTNAKAAVLINPLKTNAILKKFSFWIEKDQQAPQSSVLAPLLISFYDVSDVTNLPDGLILRTPIFYFPKKPGKQTLNLDSLQVSIPSNGIYVSLQYVMNEEYEWQGTLKWKDGEEGVERDSIFTRYGANIVGLFCKNSELAFYDGIKDNWFSSIRPIVLSTSFYNTIKFEAAIKYCEGE